MNYGKITGFTQVWQVDSSWKRSQNTYRVPRASRVEDPIPLTNENTTKFFQIYLFGRILAMTADV